VGVLSYFVDYHVKDWVQLFAAASKISLHFVVNNLAKIVQYYLRNGAYYTAYLSLVLDKKLSVDWESSRTAGAPSGYVPVPLVVSK